MNMHVWEHHGCIEGAARGSEPEDGAVGGFLPAVISAVDTAAVEMFLAQRNRAVRAQESENRSVP